MKFLEHSHFEALNSALNFDAGVYQIVGRLESYSCKLVASEKRLFKLMNAADGLSPNDLEVLSPPESGSFNSRFDSFTDSEFQYTPASMISRKTLFYLIATLNASFNPDYDFSNCRAEEFSREPSVKHVMDAVDSTFFSSSARQEYNEMKSQLWSAIDSHISLSDCEIYRFNSDSNFDPWDDCSIWAYYYFFYSKKLKRIVFFTYRAVRNDDHANQPDDMFNDTGYTSFDIEII
ncbi:repressor of RNA polymerase III transcription Maf1 [Dermatophagoides farinae]|uniref:Repressor of RNA polymerase III transcription MAF1 n=1 Tax=Dermatophagoides farinae TaxID=6954 RepID=A0A9D4SI02_DERFA|nr:repressor of RNA polymerase III transcription MAF1 homolog [Dermatophagoides farinae]KAH7642246.1 repressor of rna polymerase iii transcription maf1 [Dermatophagoides farinae]